MPPLTRFPALLRALLLVGLVSLGLQPAVATAATSQGQAEKKAIAALDVRSGDDPVIVFRQPTRVARDTPIYQAGVLTPRAATATLSRSRVPRRAGVTVSTAPVVLRTGDEAAWLFYEDRAPYQAYQHAGRVVLVGVESGRVQVSRNLRWPPLIDGDLPRFLAGYDTYRDRRFRVFARGWQLEGSASSRAAAHGLLTSTGPDILGGAMRATPLATPTRQQAADQLAAERSCAIRVSDTLGSFYDAGGVDRTRQALGTVFNQLAQLNPQFFTARYRYRDGTPQEFVAHAIERKGCKDVLLYLGGGGYAGASAAVNVGTRGLDGGRVEQQVVTAPALRAVLRAHRGVTFKVLIDAPYSGGFLPVLRRESNLVFFASSSGARDGAYTALADVVDHDGLPVANAYNPRGFLEFTNRMLTGLGCFLSRPDEVAAATRAKADGRTRSFLAWMLGRSLSLCAEGSLAPQIAGDGIAGGPTPVVFAAGGTPTDPTADNRAPVATAGSVATDEDAPVAVKLTGSDADGHALRYAVVGGPSHGRLTAAPGDGSSLVYTPDRDFAGSDALTFTVSDGIATSAPTTVSIAVAPVDDAPVATLGGGTTTFTEPGPAVAVDPGLELTDVDDTTLAGATVRITGGFSAGEDELVFVDQAGISGDYDAASGTLTLTGDASVDEYRAGVRSVAFANDGANPIAGPRDVELVVDDGERTSEPVVRPVAFVTVNDAPVLGGGGTTAGYVEDDTVGVVVAPTLTVADVDHATLDGATVAISGGHAAGEDELTFANQAGISGAFDAPSGVLTLSGTATKAEYEAALRSVRYRNLNLGQPSTAARTIEARVDDGSDADALSAVVATTVTVTPVNDAPTVTAGGGASYTEGDAPATVDPAVAVADVDDTQIGGATVTIGAGFDAADDVLALPTTPLWATASFSPITGVLTISGTASKADYQALLRTVTYANADGDDPSTAARTIAFRVTDSALASDPASTTLAVAPVNDAPVLSGGGNTVTFEEDDTAGVIVNAAITVADVDSADQAGATVSLTTGFVASEDELVFVDQAGITGSYDATTGVLTLTGGATKAQYETALRSVRYRNANTGNPSATSRVVQFRIDDGAATSNVSSAVVSTVDVDPSDDSPTTVAGGVSPTFTEGDAPVIVDPAIEVGDVDDPNLTGASVTIGSGFVSSEDELDFADTATITGGYDAATGVLTLTGTASVAAYQDALRSVTYVNTNGDDPSPTSRELAFTVSNAGLPSGPALTTVDIDPVNDAPTLGGGAPSTVTYTEDDGVGVVLDAALTVADVDSTDLAGATVRLTTGLATAEDELLFVDESGIAGSYDAASGTLTLTGSATKAEYQAALRSVRYRNGSDDPSTATRTFSVQVSDGATADALSGARTGTITVEAVNDAPTVTAGSTSASFVEDSLSGVVVDSTVTVADVDSPTISSATVSISGNWNAGEDVLALPTTLGLSGVYNPGSGVLTITGVATPAAYAAALRTVTYANTNTGDPATVDRGIDFAVDDGAATSANAFASVSVVPVNDAPTVSLLVGSSAFVEATSADPGSGPVAVDGSALVADVDDGDLEGATVTISADLSADDRLLFTDQSGITGEYIAATGTLSLTGTATVAEYQAAIRSVRFGNVSDTPSTATRTVSVQVTDGDDPSTTETRDVSVTASDDLPTVTLSGSAPDFTEAGSPVVVDGGLTVADVDSANLQSATVCVCSGRVNAEDELLYTTTNGITATAYDAATGTLTLSGPGTKADFEAALRTVEYRNTDLVTPDPGPRGIDFVVGDGSSDSGAATKTLTITTLNDPPVLGGGGNSVSYTEDDPATAVNGALTVTDNDDTELDGATVALTAGFDADEDVLALPSTPGLSAAYDAASGVLTIIGTATEAAYEAALRTVTYVNDDHTSPSSASRTVSFVANDGEEDSDPATTTIAIAQNPDAPTVSTDVDAPASFTENGSAVVVDDGLTVADVDSTMLSGAIVDVTSGFSAAQGDVLGFTPTGSITGSYNATTGVLTLSGSGTKAEYQDVLRSVTYANTSEDPTTSRTVRFRVTDETAETSAGATRTVTIVPVNDAPTLASGGTLGYTENDAATPISPALTVADADGNGINGATVAITDGFAVGQDVLSLAAVGGISGLYNATTGVLTLTGSGTKAEYQAALRTVRYANASDNPSTAARTITYTISDTGSPVLTGTATATVNVTAVNDAPAADDESFSGTDAAIGNTSLVGDDPTDGAPDPTGPQKTITADILSGDTDVEGDTVSVVPGTFATNDGGSVTVQADGDFTFTPATGTSCSDASDFFDYTATDGQTPTPGTDTGRVTIAITDCVWYVDNQAAAGGDGRSDTPFDTLGEADSAATTTGAYLYVYRGDGTATGLSGGASLLANQRLVGAAESLTVAGHTLETGNDAQRPSVSGRVTLGSGNTVEGLAIASSAAPAIDGGTGDASGTLDDLSLTSSGAGGGGIALDGTSGTWAISNATVTATGGAQAIYVNAAGTVQFADTGTISASTTAGRGVTIVGTATSGTIDQTTVNGSPSTGIALTNNTGSLTLDDVALTTTGTGLLISNSNNVTVRTQSGARGDISSSGTAVDLNTDGGGANPATPPSVTLDQVSSSGGTQGITLDDIASGTFSANGGTLTGHSDAEIEVVGGAGNVSYGGSIGNGSGLTARITGRTGGAVAVFGTLGDTGDTGGGIAMSGNGGGSTTFSGATKTLNTGTSDAVSAAFTGNHALRFTGGGLDIDTTSGAGFSATASNGQVAVAGAGNSITTTSGRALDVNGPDIEAAGLTFQSIASNGAPSGIRLANTGSAGGLTVTGSGTTAGSGGTITASTGPGIDLSSTSAVSLTRLNVTSGGDDGIRGAAVNGLALTANAITGNGNTTGENGIDLTELSGTSTVTGATVTANYSNQVSVENDTATVTGLTVDGGTYGNSVAPGGNDGILLHNTGTGGLTATIQNTLMTMNRGDHVQVTTDASNSATQNVSILDNTMRGDGNQPSPVTLGGGITVNPAGAANTTVTATGNDIERARDSAIVVNSPLASTATVKATITGNTIGTSGELRSGSATGDGIYVNGHGNSTITTLIANNDIRAWTNMEAIGIIQNDGDGTINATVRGNTLLEPDDAVGFGTHGMRIVIGSDVTDNGTSCLDIGHPSTTGLKNRVFGGGTQFYDDIRFRMAGGAPGAPSTAQLVGFTGGAHDTAAVNAYLKARNDIGGTPTASSSQFDAHSFYANAASCPTP